MTDDSRRDDGGAAFPVWPASKSDGPWPVSTGMSLRDYFAAAALPVAYKIVGDMSVTEVARMLGLEGAHDFFESKYLPRAVAKVADRVADAMLRARSAGEG